VRLATFSSLAPTQRGGGLTNRMKDQAYELGTQAARGRLVPKYANGLH